MKKVFAIVISVLFFASLCIAVLGCKKAPEQETAPKVEAPAAPAAQPAPGAPGATEAPAK